MGSSLLTKQDREKRLGPLVKWNGGFIRNSKAEKSENSITSWKSEHMEVILGSKESKNWFNKDSGMICWLFYKRKYYIIALSYYTHKLHMD